MPVTLLEAKKNVQDDLQLTVYDEFAKNNFFLEHMQFDDVVSPTGGGATMTYSYTRLQTQPNAHPRAVNEEYKPEEVTKKRFSTDLKIFGGSYQIDRIIAGMGGIVNEVTLQMQQKIKASKALFNDMMINGNSAVDEKSFDGLEVAVTGSTTEVTLPTPLDLTTSQKVTDNFLEAGDILDEFLMVLNGTPSFIASNTKMIAKLRAVARRTGMYQTSLSEWGSQIESYGTIPLVDLGAKAGSNDPIVTADSKGVTPIYVGILGMDGLHGITMAGQPMINSWLPDYTTSGAVKTGEVEMVAGMALKQTKSAGILRGFKV